MAGALALAAGIPVLLFLGLLVLPHFVRGNQNLYDAIERRDLLTVQDLLRRGADANSTWRGLQVLSAREPDRRRHFDNAPLIRAIQLDQPAIAVALISHDADVNARDADGTPALMLAAQRGQTEVVKRLLERGADVQVTDRHGNSVLRYRADTSQEPQAIGSDIRELLLKAGARE